MVPSLNQTNFLFLQRQYNFVPFRFHRGLSSHFRRYAKPSKGPGFNSSFETNPEEVFRKAKSSAKAKAKATQNEEPIEPPEPKRRRRFGLSPGRIILVSAFTYVCYRVYNWQTNPHRSLILNGKFFTPFVLKSKDPVSSTSSIFDLLSVPTGQNTYNIDEARKLGVWSVQVMQPELQIARSYTPLPPNDRSTPEQIRLLVRKEPQGEVSGFLHRLALGSIVHLRGPHPEYVIPDDVEEILFLAGGTGIAPALQIIHCLFTVRDGPGDRKPNIRILWANRRAEDSYAGPRQTSLESLRASILSRVRASMDSDPKKSPTSDGAAIALDSEEAAEQTALVKELEALRLKHGSKLSINYFVDEDNTYITESVLRKHLSGSSDMQSAGEGTGKKVVLISGPDGFVSMLGGPKGMQGGRETQGPLGGLLERIRPENWIIWKL